MTKVFFPFIKEIASIAEQTDIGTKNLGLLYHKYLSVESQEGDHPYKVCSEDIARLTQIKMPSAYPIWLKYRQKSLEREKHFCFAGKTTARLVCGIGNASTTEVGFTFHHLYGFPIIPGSSLKGIALHYFLRYYEKFNNDFPCIRYIIFGHEPSDDENEFNDKKTLDDRQGGIIFHDAWPHEKSHDFLYLDVMAPHYSEYYDKQQFPLRKINIIPFLTISPNTCFYFWLGISQRLRYCQRIWDSPVQHPESQKKSLEEVQVDSMLRQEWTDIVNGLPELSKELQFSFPQPLTKDNVHDLLLHITYHLLQKALDNWGIGAKSSSGYGYMSLQKGKSDGRN